MRLRRRLWRRARPGFRLPFCRRRQWHARPNSRHRGDLEDLRNVGPSAQSLRGGHGRPIDLAPRMLSWGFSASPARGDSEFAIGNGSKVRTRGSPVCRAVAHGSVAVTLLWALPVHATDDVTELLGQVKKQLEQSQHQMEQSHRQLEQSQRQLEQSQREVKALKQQVEVLTKRVEQTPAAPPPGAAPAPDATNVVAMQQPGNLPGRKQEPAPAATGPLSKDQSPQPVLHNPVHDLV